MSTRTPREQAVCDRSFRKGCQALAKAGTKWNAKQHRKTRVLPTPPQGRMR